MQLKIYLLDFYKNNKIFVWIFILAAFLIFYKISYVDMEHDDAIYSTRSIGLVDYMFGDKQPTPLVWNESYPWWANLSYHDHPPLLFLIQYLFLLFSHTVLAAKIPYALFALGTLTLTYLWSKNLFNKQTAIAATALLVLNSYFIWSARITYLEGGVLFFIMLTLFFLDKFTLDPKKYWLPFGTALGLALITKYTALFIIPAILFYLLFKKKQLYKNKKLYLALLVSFLLISPQIIYNLMMYRTTGHFDLQISGLLHQPSPWALGRNIQHNYLIAFLNIIKILGHAASWLYLALFIPSLAFFIFKSKKTILLSCLIFLTILFLLIGPVERFLSLYNPFLAIIIGYSIASLYLLINKKTKLLKNTYRVIATIFAVYLLLFTVNSHLISQPFEYRVGLSHSFPKSENYGITQLDNYLNNLTKNKYIVNRSNYQAELKNKHQWLKQFNFIRPMALPRDKKLMYELFVYDKNINWFSRVWLFERRIFYDNMTFIDVQGLSDLNQTSDTEKYYFIKATNNTYLESRRRRTKLANMLEEYFINLGIKPTKLIYNLKGEVAFKIYHFDINQLKQQ